MLEMQSLEGMSVKEIMALLNEQEKQPFDIYFPKETQEFFSTKLAIALDYGKLAYVGQRLSNIARSFNYTEVPPSENESVPFTVGTGDLQQLAEVLLELSYGYVNETEDEEHDFDADVEEFLAEVEEGGLEPACPYFIEIYSEYMPDEDEDE